MHSLAQRRLVEGVIWLCAGAHLARIRGTRPASPIWSATLAGVLVLSVVYSTFCM